MHKLRIWCNLDCEVDVHKNLKSPEQIKGAIIECLGSYNASNVIIFKKEIVDAFEDDDWDDDDDDDNEDKKFAVDLGN